MAYIEKRKNGKFRVQVRRKGSIPACKTFSRKTDAENWAKQQEVDIQTGADVTTHASNKRTLSELIDRYIADKLSKKDNEKSIFQTKQKLEIWRQYLGGYYLSKISSELIMETRTKISNLPTPKKWGTENKSNATVNRYHAALSVVFSYAFKELRWIKVNPIAAVSKLPEPPGIVRFLSDTEREKLLSELDKKDDLPFKAIVISALITGARMDELAGLRWTDIDMVKKIAFVKKSKNKEPKVLPLVEPALSLIEELYSKRHSEGYVFSRTGETKLRVESIWQDFKPKLGFVINFRFHDLRHTCASYMAQNNVPLLNIADVLGHKTLQITKRYAHLAYQNKMETMQSVCEKVYGHKINSIKSDNLK